MCCLAFRVLHLLYGWKKVCGLSCVYHGEWRRLVKFDLCALMSQGWYFRDQWIGDLCSGRVRLGTNSSENWEPVLLMIFESLLKRGGFIVMASTGAEIFSIPNFFTRARDAEVSNFVRGAAVSSGKCMLNMENNFSP
ncbi:hypothetical protein V202x_35760 [Gimesia aquarii]|uniref:Uncharacterized protein n=1 Tax=Gimesia aquarii TaxID=2527964 RepID=A0A517WY38_9PLAN|nr:hypothetical protein V202x_35760 [Gimesia aquarii]